MPVTLSRVAGTSFFIFFGFLLSPSHRYRFFVISAFFLSLPRSRIIANIILYTDLVIQRQARQKTLNECIDVLASDRLSKVKRMRL
jgi:hypothetical protein